MCPFLKKKYNIGSRDLTVDYFVIIVWINVLQFRVWISFGFKYFGSWLKCAGSGRVLC